ncbi:hypothetical protein BB560_005523, partial [Smittium megazygosporum]
MATRSRTFLFIQYRSSYGHTHRNRRNVENESALYRPIEYTGLIDNVSEHSHSIEMVDKVQEVNVIMDAIPSQVQRLKKLHNEHLLPGFNDRTDDELKINKLTLEITNNFQNCQRLIHSIYNPNLKGQNLAMSKNIQMSLAQKIQQLSLVFQKTQQTYLKQLSKRNNQSKDVFESELPEDDRIAMEYTFDLNLTDEQILDYEAASSAVKNRESEVEMIHKSIVDLSVIFKDMQQMVIHQGTLLDRIDFNVENTVVNVEAAKEELKKAEKKMGKLERK